MGKALTLSRRRFLGAAGVVGGGEEAAPAEDLMREHGVLRRILFVYDELAARLNEGKEFPAGVLADSADLIRHFVEDYHERLEENHVFPRLERKGQLVDLVKVPREQHQTGRRLTQALRARATAAALATPEERKQAADDLRRFARMYRPHAAREDTVLFPAFHALVSEREYERLGDAFEDKERALFGPHGFEEKILAVAAIEAEVGLADLS